MLSAALKRMIGRPVLTASAVLAGSWLLVLALGVGVPLNALRTPVEATLSRTLGQVVNIEGPITVRPTLGPSVIVRELRIADRPGGQGVEQLRAGQVEAQVGLLSLLRDRPEVTRLQARDVTVNLASLDEIIGRAWSAPTLKRPLDLSLHNLILHYRTGAMDERLQLAFEQLTGSVLPDQPLQLMVNGRLGPFPYVAGLTLPSQAMLLWPGESLPLQASLDLAGIRLQLQGTLASPTTGQGPVLELDLQDNRTATADPALKTAGEPAITGKLSLLVRDGRPQLDGELQLAVLDMAHLTGLAGSGAMPADAAMPSLAWLNGIDVALFVSIDETSSTPMAVRDIRINLALRDGQLNAPTGALIGGVPFNGNVLFDPRAELPVFALSLAAANIDAATLLHDLPVFAGVQGDVTHVELNATVPDTGTGIDTGMRVSGARLSYGNTPGSQPVSAVLDELTLSLPAEGAVTMTAHGALADAPFDLELTGGSLDALLQHEAWPISVTATGGATLMASGKLASQSGDSTGTLNLEVSGERLGDLAPWLGVSVCAATTYTASGQIQLAKDIGRLQFLKAQLGSTQLTGELDWSRFEQLPMLHAVLRVDTLNPADVAGLLPVMSYANGVDTKSGIRFDIPILPRPVVIANADIDLSMAKIAHNLADITDVSFTGQLRNGEFQRSPFRARIGNRVLQGQLDTHGADTGVAFEVSADDAASGSLLDRLFSSAIEWVENAGVVPLRLLFGLSLSEPVTQECNSGSQAVSGAEGK